MQTHENKRLFPFSGRGWLLPLVLFVLAWLPRLAALQRYITPDELIWVYRSVQFREALLAGNWLETLTSGHPGVTTTWLGALGISLQMLFSSQSLAAYEWVTRLAFMTPDNMAAFRQLAILLPAARLATTAVTAAGIPVIYLLARPLFGPVAALLAALLLAFDPFIAGLSGLHHVDGLLATLTTVGLLLLAQAVFRPGSSARRRFVTLAAAGTTTALALLTKSPAVLLVPVAGLFVLIGGWGQAGGQGRAALRLWLRYGFVFAAFMLVTAVLLLPALWAGPEAVLARTGADATRHLDSALRPTFFLGSVAFDHGPLFYPVALVFRLSPVVFVGLLLGGGRLLWRRPGGHGPQAATAVMLLLWSLLFMVGITLAAKKFDRYMLPALPPLLLVAALVWSGWLNTSRNWRRWALGGLAGVQLLWLLSAWPYPLAAYNPTVGGPWLASRVLTQGWGEAISAAGQWLAAQPDAAEKTAVAGIGPSFAPYFPGTALLSGSQTTPLADYIVATAGGRQLNPESDPAADPDLTLVHTVRFGGQEQAWIYAQANPARIEPPAALTTPVSFGGRVQLQALDARVVEQRIKVQARWQLLQPNGRYTVQVQIRDEQDRIWAQPEFPLVNDVSFYPEHWAPGETTVVGYEVDPPDVAPPGTYRVALSLFETTTNAQLPVTGGDNAFLGLVYPGPALSWPRSAAPVTLQLDQIPQQQEASWLDGRLLLRGHSLLPARLATGFETTVDVYWQAVEALPDDLQVALFVDELLVWEGPLSPYDSGQWRPGEFVQTKLPLVAPVDLAAGSAAVRMQVLSAAGEPLGAAVTLGAVELLAIDRLFALPADVGQTVAVDFGETLTLAGVMLPDTAVDAVSAPGSRLPIALTWQVRARPAVILTAFVHVVGPDGQIVAQSDQWPGGLPTDARVAGEAIVDVHTIDLPPDLPPGAYRLAVGVYTTQGGVRLPVVGVATDAVDDNRFFLPLTLEVAGGE